ncbi:MAG: Hsp20/alpha crystallin family protein [Desulforegulaceae bacterium]|nr:Hsp20/alpha crystallin family protein [Desulforegulaceae bacterium]
MSYIKIIFGNPVNCTKSSSYQTFQTINPMFSFEDKWKPQMDIYETEEEIILTAEISGVKKEELEIEIDKKAARISGIRRPIMPTKDARYRLAEIQYGKFERVIFLPSQIDTEKVSASYQNGFLHLTMGKVSTKTFHSIKIEEEK